MISTLRRKVRTSMRGLALATLGFMSCAVAALELGTHVHDLGAGAAWPPSAFSVVRLWDARVAWPDLEPAPGRWQFGKLDRIVAEGEQHQRGLLLPLALSPPWASSRPDELSAYRPGNAAMPRSVADWANYVDTVGRRYKGRVEAYEVWNEPNKPRFFSGDVSDVVSLACAARRVLREVDPSARLVSPSATSQLQGIDWLGRFLAAGGGACIDVVGFHFYTLAHEPPEAVVPLIAAMRDTMRRHGLEHLPLWDTEFGWFIANARSPVDTRYRVVSQNVASAYLARAWLLRAALGVERAYFYAWNNRNMGLLEPDSGEPKRAAAVLPRVKAWTDPPFSVGTCKPEQHLWRCPVARDGRTVGVIAWAAGPAAEGPMLRLLAAERGRGARLESAEGNTDDLAPGMPVRMLQP